MTFPQSVRTCLRHYADFSGRASRSEFWWFFLFTTLVSLVSTLPLYLLIGFLIAASEDGSGTLVVSVLLVVWSLLITLLSIALLIPLLAVGARRLHDHGQTAWLLLLYFVPCGNIVLIVLWALESTPGDNPYGPPPTL